MAKKYPYLKYTEFNTQNLLAGGLNDTFHVGANAGQNVSLTIKAMDAASLKVAGSSIATTFTNTNTHIATFSTNSPNLNGYYVNAKYTAADASSITQSNADGGTGTADVTSFTGSADTVFQVKILATGAGGLVTAAEYTTTM